jgi:hypothetical protein
MCPNCHRDKISLIVEHLLWTWVPPLSFSTTAAIPGGNDDGHIRYRLIIDVVADIKAGFLAIIIIIVIIIKQQRVLHAHQPICAPPQ